MRLFGRRRRSLRGAGAARADRKQELDDVRAHLEHFVRTRVGVEAFLEPPTTVTPPTVLLVATDGEWTRRRVPDPRIVRGLAERLAVPVYDVRLVGYPQAHARLERAQPAAPRAPAAPGLRVRPASTGAAPVRATGGPATTRGGRGRAGRTGRAAPRRARAARAAPASRPPVDIGRLGRRRHRSAGRGCRARRPAPAAAGRRPAPARPPGRHRSRARTTRRRAAPTARTAAATASERRTPPSGRALEDGDVRGARARDGQRVLRAADRLVRGDRHVRAARAGPPAPARSRTAARRTAGRPPPASRTSSARTASSTAQRPLASTRTCPPGPSASRTAATRAASAASAADPGRRVRDLDLRRAAPRAAHDLGGTVRAHRRHGRVHRHPVADGLPATRARRPPAPLASHVAATSSSYSANGQKSPQPRGPAEQHPLAHGDAAEPVLQGDGVHVQRDPWRRRFSAASGHTGREREG